MSERKSLKGTRVCFNEELSKEMQDLDYRARICYKNNALPRYLTRKDHILVLQGQGQKGIKIWDQSDMDHVLSTFSMMNFQGSYVPPHLRNPPKMGELEGVSGDGLGNPQGDGGSLGNPLPGSNPGISVSDVKSQDSNLDNIKSKADLQKAIASGVYVPFDHVLKILEGHFSEEIKAKLDRGEQLGVNNDGDKMEDEEGSGV